MRAAQKNMSIRLAVIDGKRVEDNFDRIGQKGEQAMGRISRSTAPANAGLKAVDTTARALNSVFRQAAGLVAAYAGLSGIIGGIRSVNETGMAFQGLDTALAAVTGSSQGAAAEMAFLRAESERLGLNLLETSQSYLQIAAAAKGTQLAGQGTRDIFTAIAEASTVLQLSVDQTNGALRAIGQIMSKGKVQTEELRGQLGERLYGAFQLAARGMGITTAELDKMLEQGQIVSEDFLPRFAAEIRRTFSEGVPEASKNARAELNRFTNSVLEIERTIAAAGFLDGLSQGYRTLADTLADPAVQDAARALGETLGSVIVTTAEALAFLIENADLAVTAIGGLVIARTVAGAVAMLNAAIVSNAGMIVGLRLAASLSTTFALRLVAMEAATKLATVAMIGFRAALALVGGPVGLAVLAGIALIKLASGHDAAAKAARDHAQELKEVKEELGLTAKAAVRKRYEALNTTLEGAIARAEKWRNEAMLGLNQTAAGYEEFSKQVEAVYQDMLREAREEDLRSSKRWEDGVKRGLKSVMEDAQDMASKAERGVTSMFKNMEDALVSFVQTGKMDFKSFADSIIADLLRIQIQSSITTPLAGALNTFIGGFFGGNGATATSTAHTGGVIGHDSLVTKRVHPSVFNGAPRFHTGGVVGNEIPIIAKKGETVFTPGQMQLLGGALQSKPNVNVSVKVENNVAGADASATVRRDSAGNLDLNIVIEEVETKMARNIGRGEGLASTLERRYGLNPAAGSYR